MFERYLFDGVDKVINRYSDSIFLLAGFAFGGHLNNATRQAWKGGKELAKLTNILYHQSGLDHLVDRMSETHD